MRLLRRGPCDCRRGIRTSGKSLGRFPQEARREASCTSRQKLPPCTSPGSSGLEVAKNASGCSEVCMFAACPASGRSSRASGSTSLKRAHLLVSGRLRPLQPPIRPDDSALPPRGHGSSADSDRSRATTAVAAALASPCRAASSASAAATIESCFSIASAVASPPTPASSFARASCFFSDNHNAWYLAGVDLKDASASFALLTALPSPLCAATLAAVHI